MKPYALDLFYGSVCGKKGRIVYHATAGKNTIGTARPGKSSGNSISNGRVNEIGRTTAANVIIMKLKTISPFFLGNHRNPIAYQPGNICGDIRCNQPGCVKQFGIIYLCSKKINPGIDNCCKVAIIPEKKL